MEADAPKEVDTTLAGWVSALVLSRMEISLTVSAQGSWGGTGVKKAAPKPYLIKQVAGIDPKSRADYNKAHVIISEKRDKKAAKYQVKDLPYPYTSKAQFERSIDTPLGTEWNTRVGFQRGTLPKVTKKVSSSLYLCPLRTVDHAVHRWAQLSRLSKNCSDTGRHVTSVNVIYSPSPVTIIIMHRIRW